MNGTAWSYEDAVRTVTTATLQPTALPPMPALTAPRNAAGPLEVDKIDKIDTVVTNGEINTTTGASPWLRTNPHASPNNSKTSQYIDKITQENEKLRRELRAERLAREDEAKRVSAAKTKAEDSRAEHQQLQVLADVNARAIERKDRKIEELKAALDAENRRREAADRRAEEALKMLGDTRSETQRQLASAYELRLRAEANADSIKTGYSRKYDTFEKQIKALQQEVQKLRKERMDDADKYRRQAIVSDQLRHETARALRTEGAMKNMLGEYKKEYRKELDALVEDAHHMRTALPSKEEEAAALLAALKATQDQMKWVMAQKKRQDGLN